MSQPRDDAIGGIVASALAAVSGAAERERGRPRHRLNLASNELTHGAAAALIEDALRTIASDRAMKYPDYAAAGKTVADNLHLDEHNVALAPGSDAAIQHICSTFGRAAGQVVLAWPNYPGWDLYGRLYGLQIERVQTSLIDGDLLVDQVLDKVRELSDCVVAVASPDPIWGATISATGLERLARECQARGHILVVDECYRYFREDGGASLTPQGGAIHLQSLSKGYGLAGARLAVVAGSAHLLEVLRRDRMEGGVSGLAVALFEGVLAQGESKWKAVWSDIRQQRRIVAEEASRLLRDWRVVAGCGNFVAFVAPSVMAHAEMLQGAEESGIRLRDLASMGVDQGLRATIGDDRVSAELLGLLRVRASM